MHRQLAILAALAASACGSEPAAPPEQAADAVQPAAPAPTAQPAAQKTVTPAGDGQNFAIAANGPLKIVGSDNQYDIVLPTDVLFDFDKSELRAGATPLLEQVKAHLDANGSDQLHVRGYTDAKGDDQYNYRLSMRRAAAVCNWLKARGETFTNCIGRGENEPVAPNANADGSDNPLGRQQNRRVTISVIKYPDAKAMLEKAKAQAAGARTQ